MRNLRFNPAKMSHKLIVAGLAGLIDEDGLTFHEAMEVLEDIKSQTFPALAEMAAENRAKAAGHQPTESA